MKPLLWIGLVILILGVASLFVPIPHREQHGVTIGDVSLGVQTTNDEKVSPILSSVMILGGLGAMAVGMKK